MKVGIKKAWRKLISGFFNMTKFQLRKGSSMPHAFSVLISTIYHTAISKKYSWKWLSWPLNQSSYSKWRQDILKILLNLWRSRSQHTLQSRITKTRLFWDFASKSNFLVGMLFRQQTIYLRIKHLSEISQDTYLRTCSPPFSYQMNGLLLRAKSSNFCRVNFSSKQNSISSKMLYSYTCMQS